MLSAYTRSVGSACSSCLLIRCEELTHVCCWDSYAWLGMGVIPDALTYLRQQASEPPAPVDQDADFLGRKTKSLSTLTQRFIQLFLIEPDKTIALESAAYILSGTHPAVHSP